VVNPVKNIIASAAFAMPLFAPLTLHAENAPVCNLGVETSPRSVMIDNSWKGTSVDGGGGIDTFWINGPTYFLPRPERLKSLEVFDMKNGLFDTVVVNADMIATTELGEIEIISDWFDQVILDPEVNWLRTIDDTFSSQKFKTVQSGETLTVKTDLKAHILAPSELPLVTKEGPKGAFDPKTVKTVVMGLHPSETDTADAAFHLRSPNADVVQFNFKALDDQMKRIVLNTEDGFSNAVVIDITKVNLSVDREFVFNGDRFDRIILAQPGCWSVSDASDDVQNTARYLKGNQGGMTLTADAHHLKAWRAGRFTVGRVQSPGYRHLTADGIHAYDQIDLVNGGPDTLIIRNSAHLRPDVPVVLRGDPGLDHIWLEGSAGWTLDYQDKGVVAQVPFGKDADITLAFMPGLEVSILPVPVFLNNPEMLELPAYPGLTDDVRDKSTLIVTRAGFAKFSANQLANIEHVDFTNGIANTVLISPEQLVSARPALQFHGDEGLDTILAIGMPDAITDSQKGLTWTLSRPDGTTLTVSATGFSYLSHAITRNETVK